jgi:predicted aconitase with swiveling domain
MGGKAKGEAIVTTRPISFWGGIDPQTGVVIDKRNELYGSSISGKVFVFLYGRGSSTSSAVLLEAVRCDNAPVAIVNVETEPLLVVGVILAQKLYGKTIPVVDSFEVNPCEQMANDDSVTVDGDRGVVEVRRKVMKGTRV